MKWLVALGLFSIVGLASAQSFVNPGFESPDLGAGNWNYGVSGATWTGHNNCGIANHASSWGTDVFAGNQYLFLENVADVSQTVTGFVAGRKYHLTFAMACRDGDVGGNQPNAVEVLLDDTTPIFPATMPAYSGVWFKYETASFTATKDTYKFTIAGTSSDSDRTSRIDDVEILGTTTTPPDGQFMNGGFELPYLSPGQWQEEPNWADTVWTGTYNWGIANGVSAWGNGAFAGSQYAFLQSSGNAATISQSVGGLTVGALYRVHFELARRTGDQGGTSGIPIAVMLDGKYVLLPPTSPSSSGSWSQVTTAMFVATKTHHTFTWVTSHSSGDSSDLLDAISLKMVATAPALAFANPSFQSPHVTPHTFVDNPVGGSVSWTGVGWGIFNGSSVWGADGQSSTQAAYLSSVKGGPVAEVSQDLDGFVIGRKYKVTFYMAQGKPGTSAEGNAMHVLAGGKSIFAATEPDPSGSWLPYETAVFTASSDQMTITFKGAAASKLHPDLATLLDRVAIVPMD